MTIQRALKIFFCIPVVLQVVLLCSVLLCLGNLKHEIDRQIKFKNLQATIDKFQRRQTESLTCAFFANVTGYPRLKQQNRDTIAGLNNLMPALKAKFANNPDFSNSIDEIIRGEKQLLKFQVLLEKVPLSTLFSYPDASIRINVLIKGSLGSVRHLVAKLEDSAVINNSGWSKQWLVALAATIAVFVFELALAINWSSRIFVGRLSSIFERIAEFDRGETVATAVPPVTLTDEFAQVEASVFRANYEIGELENSRRELSSIVAHDIRAPLTSIAGSLELLEQGVFGELPLQSRPQFSKVRQVSNNLIFAANLLLEFAKPESLDRHCHDITAERLEDSIYEVLDQFGLAGLKDFSCDVQTPGMRLPESTVGKLVAFIIKSMGQPDGISVTVFDQPDTRPGDGSDSVVVKLTFPPSCQTSLDDFQRIQQNSSLKMVALMLGIHNAQLVEATTDSSYDLELLFPQGGFKAATREPRVGQESDKNDTVHEEIGYKNAKSHKPRSFHRTLVILLVVTISINLITVSGLAYVWQRGQSQLTNEIESRNAIYRASVVSANLTELMLVSLFRSPHLERYRKNISEQIEKIFKRLEKQKQRVSGEHLLEWKRSVDQILASCRKIGSATAEEMPPLIKQLIDHDKLDVLLTENAGRLLVNDEQASTVYSTRLLKLFEQIRVQIICISIIGAFVSISAAMFLSHYLIARLEHVKNNADALITKRPLSPPLFGSDDIASLDRFFYEAARRIEELERNKMQLSSLLKDDLSTLIAQMRGKLEDVIAAASVPERAKEQLDSVHSALARLSLLVDDLECSNSIGASGKESLQISLKITEIDDVIKDTIEAVAYQAKLKDVRLQVSNLCQADARINVDAKRLVQVLVNLLSNAIKNSSPGSRVLVEATESANDITIAIVDSGKGIEPEVMDKLFQRFSTTDTENHGVGLGLYISKFLVNVQGGTIGVSSTPLIGSRFWVTFPAADN